MARDPGGVLKDPNGLRDANWIHGTPIGLMARGSQRKWNGAIYLHIIVDPRTEHSLLHLSIPPLDKNPSQALVNQFQAGFRFSEGVLKAMESRLGCRMAGKPKQHGEIIYVFVCLSSLRFLITVTVIGFGLEDLVAE